MGYLVEDPSRVQEVSAGGGMEGGRREEGWREEGGWTREVG